MGRFVLNSLEATWKTEGRHSSLFCQTPKSPKSEKCYTLLKNIVICTNHLQTLEIGLHSWYTVAHLNTGQKKQGEKWSKLKPSCIQGNIERHANAQVNMEAQKNLRRPKVFTLGWTICKTNRTLQPSTIKKLNETQGTGEFDFQCYNTVIFKCSIINKKYIRNTKK